MSNSYSMAASKQSLQGSDSKRRLAAATQARNCNLDFMTV
jgi:hypothetical protein